jgi:multiple sugar transport system ATP-binding protein
MASLSCKHIYNKKLSISDFNAEIKEESFLILFGNEHSGKSEILRIIAGLESCSSGELQINHQVMNCVDTQDREVGMVFPDYILYPHMTIYDNIAFCLKQHKFPKDQIDTSIRTIAQILEFEHLLHQMPDSLNKSEKLCVAIGRAVIRRPKIVLLDNPLAALKESDRIQMRKKLINLHKSLHLTIIYATDHAADASVMGTDMIILNHGTIEQSGPPLTLYESPCNTTVAKMTGCTGMNFLESICMIRDISVSLKIEDMEIKLPQDKAEKLIAGNYNAKYMIAGIRPEHISICIKRPNIEYGYLEGTVQQNIALGAETYLYIKTLLHYLTVQIPSDLKPQIGDEVFLLPDYTKIYIFDMDTKEIIAFS